MVGTLCVLDQGLNVVVIQPGKYTQIPRLDFQSPLKRRLRLRRERDTKQIVQRVAKRHAPGAAFLLHPLEDILVEGDCRSDAHDAYMLASLASNRIIPVPHTGPLLAPDSVAISFHSYLHGRRRPNLQRPVAPSAADPADYRSMDFPLAACSLH